MHARTHARAPLFPRPAPLPPPHSPLHPLPPPPPPLTQHFSHCFLLRQFFYLCSLHIGIRQGAALLELGDLEAVASTRGSPQLGGYPAIFPAFRFLYRVSTGDYSEIIGPGWHLSSPGLTCHETRRIFLGARNLPDQLSHGVFGFMRARSHQP
jgi:hypothetical protein